MSEKKSPIAALDTANDGTYFLVWYTLASQLGTEVANSSYMQVRWLIRNGEVVSTELILKLYEDYAAH